MLIQQDIVRIGELLDRKLDQRFAEFEKKIDQKFADFERKFDEKLEKRLVAFEKKIDKKLDKRFEEFEKRFEKRFVAIEAMIFYENAASEARMYAFIEITILASEERIITQVKGMFIEAGINMSPKKLPN